MKPQTLSQHMNQDKFTLDDKFEDPLHNSDYTVSEEDNEVAGINGTDGKDVKMQTKVTFWTVANQTFLGKSDCYPAEKRLYIKNIVPPMSSIGI